MLYFNLIQDGQNLLLSNPSHINLSYSKKDAIKIYNVCRSTNREEHYLPRFLLEEKGKRHLWSWYQGPYDVFDENWKKMKPEFPLPPPNEGSLAQVIYEVKRDGDNLWYSTEVGLFKYDGKRFTKYIPQDTIPNPDLQFAVRNILFRKDGLMWVRFVKRGIYTFNPLTGQFIKGYLYNDSKRIYSMKYDNKGSLLVGTTFGLFKYDKSNDKFIKIAISHESPNYNQKINEINDIFIDKDNLAWLATEYGLVRYNIDQNKFKYINHQYNIPSSAYARVTQDSASTIWVSSTNSIQGFNERKHKYYRIDVEDGLDENYTQTFGIFQMLKNNKLAVGSNGGIINEINTYEYTKNLDSPTISVSDIFCDGKNIDFNKWDIVKIPRKTKKVEIHFSMTNYQSDHQNKLYYRLLPSDEKWQLSEDGIVVLYALDKGNYTVELKGENISVFDAPGYSQIKIRVIPFWYETLFFKIFSILVLLIGVYILYDYRTKNMKKRAELNELIISTEMSALKAQMNPHFIFNCINSIDALIQTNDKYNATTYLNKFAKLIRNILDSSRQNLVSFNKDIETMQLYIELEQLRNEGKFKVEFIIDEYLKESNFNVPPLIIHPYIENAIIHGLRNKFENDGLLIIRASFKNNMIEYEIRDNGIGRAAASKYSRTKELSYGMQLSHDRIKLFNSDENAKVEVVDLYDQQKPIGTAIIIKLKV
jgi:hypothetical protein